MEYSIAEWEGQGKTLFDVPHGELEIRIQNEVIQMFDVSKLTDNSKLQISGTTQFLQRRQDSFGGITDFLK